MPQIIMVDGWVATAFHYTGVLIRESPIKIDAFLLDDDGVTFTPLTARDGTLRSLAADAPKTHWVVKPEKAPYTADMMHVSRPVSGEVTIYMKQFAAEQLNADPTNPIVDFTNFQPSKNNWTEEINKETK